ncbi:MAG: NAD-dependent epimerase/dehydratase family protein [Candidatus Thiodiazotropha sp.]|jgi:nucleoside-diphosphate-sugar epimerase
MKILLLGGTGAIGSHFSDILYNTNDTVVITSRSYRESQGNIEYRQGNAKNIVFLDNLIEEKWDVIVDFMNYSDEEFRERIDRFLSKTKQYIFLSSARVYNKSEVAITEESKRLLDVCKDKEYLLTSEYALSKARQENILKASSKRNWTIIRPYITYSNIRLQLGNLEKESWLYRALKGRTIVFSKDINNHYTTLTYGVDVANGIASLMNKTDSYGEAFHITCNSAYLWSDILDTYLDVLEDELGHRPKVIFQDLTDYLSWNALEYQVTFDRLFDRKFDNTKINKHINTNDFTEVKEGLRKCVHEFVKNPKFNAINWKQEAKKDRFTNEKASILEISEFKQILKYILFRYFTKD